MRDVDFTLAGLFAGSGVVAIRMGEYTLHASGELERDGKRQKVGSVSLDEKGERLTVHDVHGNAVVTEKHADCVPVFDEVAQLRVELEEAREALKQQGGVLDVAQARARAAEDKVVELQTQLLEASQATVLAEQRAEAAEIRANQAEEKMLTGGTDPVSREAVEGAQNAEG